MAFGKYDGLTEPPRLAEPCLELSAEGERKKDRIGYLPAVDGLRAIAVLSVILFHLRPGRLPGGFAGVDIFFVISGFVVTASMEGRPFTSLGDLIGRFVARRIVRIAPALIIMLMATALLSVLFVPARQIAISEKVGLAAFAGASNIILAFSSPGYFQAASADDPFLHTWTLGVEEQFYLLFPFLYALSRRPSKRLFGAHIVAVLAASSFVICCALSLVSSRLAFFLMPSRFWELGLGMILCLTIRSWRPRLEALSVLVRAGAAAFCLLCLAISFFCVPGNWAPLPLVLLPTGATAGLIALSCTSTVPWAMRSLAHAIPVAVGRASYSLYLWHWPVFALFRWTIGLDAKLCALAALAITGLLAFASYRWIEQPFRRGGAHARWKARTVVTTGLIGLTVGALSSALLFAMQPRLTQLTFEKLQRVHWKPDGCELEQSEHAFAGGRTFAWIPRCARLPGTLVAVGDSHARTYTLAYMMYASRARRPVYLYTHDGCEYPRLAAPLRPTCASFYRALSSELAQKLQRGDLLFAASLRVHRHVDPSGHALQVGELMANPADLALARRSVLADLLQLSSRGIHLVIEAPTPVVPSPAFRCSDWFNRNNPQCSSGFAADRAGLSQERAPVVMVLGALRKRVPDLSIWDPFPILCPSNPCSAFRGHVNLMLDEDHMSTHAAEMIYPTWSALLDRRFGPAQHAAQHR